MLKEGKHYKGGQNKKPTGKRPKIKLKPQSIRNMRKPASKLLFLKRILSDGSSVDLSWEEKEKLQSIDKTYDLRRLSISDGTFIASDFSTYVVALRDNQYETERYKCEQEIQDVLNKYNAELYIDNGKINVCL